MIAVIRITMCPYKPGSRRAPDWFRSPQWLHSDLEHEPLRQVGLLAFRSRRSSYLGVATTVESQRAVRSLTGTWNTMSARLSALSA